MATKKKAEEEVKNVIAEEVGEVAVEAQVEVAGETEATETKATAKAGKRSAKAIREHEEEVAKEARKESHEEDNKPKHVQKAPRTRLERAGKKYKEAIKNVDQTKEYTLKEALAAAISSSPVKFDATVELHINLNVDPKQADQNLRDNLILPSGTGKTQRVAVFADADDEAKAKKAGADITNAEELLKDLDKGVINFDVLIATPATMPKLGKYARVLGPKGLMPNPKSGTVTTDVAKAVSDSKGGKVEYRVDSTGIIHLGIGKVSFGVEKLLPNAQAVFASVKGAKPASVKGTFVKSIHMTTTMGPSIKIASNEL